LFFVALVALLLNTGGGALFASEAAASRADVAQAGPRKGASRPVQVILAAARQTTSYDTRHTERTRFDLPLLYLHHERQPADRADRTLTIAVSGLAGGAEIEVEAVSRHKNVSTGRRHREARRFVLPDRPCTSDDPCMVHWTVDPATTLSDLYTLRVRDGAGHLLWKNPYSDRPDLAMLDTWDVGLDGYTVTFSHEFFHLMQWNVLLWTGNPDRFWLHTFIEGQGKFAPSVQYPELEMSKENLTTTDSRYTKAANRFLVRRLNTSYRAIEASDDGSAGKYDTTLYWRFLYEQYGHMAIIRASIEEMEHHFDPLDAVGSMERAMDAAFARMHGPFHTFAESITAFAQANYALRLGNGRRGSSDPAAGSAGQCVERPDSAETPASIPLYCDPDDAYTTPPLETRLHYQGSRLTYDGAVPSSFGMDFIELSLYHTVNGQPLVLTFRDSHAGLDAAADVHLDVRVWKVGSRRGKRHPATPRPEPVPQSRSGVRVYRIASLDTTTYDSLVIIITRLDANEAMDPVGDYHITVE
jgi:hypothetical protein